MQLQLPYTLKLSGWAGLAVIFLSAVVADYTGKTLIRCLYYKDGERVSGYPMIGEAAFGKIGYYTVHFFHKTTLLGVCTIFLILASANLQDILAVWDLGTTLWCVLDDCVPSCR